MKSRARAEANLLEAIARHRTGEPFISVDEHDAQAARYLDAKADMVVYLFRGDYYLAPEGSPGFAILKTRFLVDCEEFCKTRRLVFTHAVTCNPFVRLQ